jgi:tetratricopeptide (TPR) repeat protein
MAALDKNNLAKAQTSFEQATRLAPKQAGAWLLLAQTYAKQKDQKAALAAAQKAESLGADDPQILQGLANFYATLVPDLPKAAHFGGRYAERSPQDVTAWNRLTAFCLNSGQLEPAIAAGTKALKLNPYDESSHFQLAQAYLLKQDFASAISTLQNAHTTFDKSPQIELALGVAYYGARKFPEAVEQFLKTMKLAPDVPQPYVFLGRMLDHVTDRLPEMTDRFAQFEARNPKSPLGYLLHAKALIAQSSEPETAFHLLEKSVALKEDDSETHLQMGVLLEQKRDFADAAKHLERSIQLNAKDSAVHFRLARVYDRLGRKEDAANERKIHEKLSEQEKAK